MGEQLRGHGELKVLLTVHLLSLRWNSVHVLDAEDIDASLVVQDEGE